MARQKYHFVCELASELLEVEDLPSSRLLPDVSESSVVEVLRCETLDLDPQKVQQKHTSPKFKMRTFRHRMKRAACFMPLV